MGQGQQQLCAAGRRGTGHEPGDRRERNLQSHFRAVRRRRGSGCAMAPGSHIPAPRRQQAAMSDSKVKLLLFMTILIVRVLPLLAALYLLDRSLQTSLNLGFNPEVAAALEDSSRNLLALKSLDPQRQSEYRQQFERIQRLRYVYAQP